MLSIVAIAMSIGHFITKLLTSLRKLLRLLLLLELLHITTSHHILTDAFHLTQTSVAILAISSLMFL